MEKFIQNMDLSAKGIWLPIILGVIALAYMLFMPKRLSWREIYFTFGVGAFLSVTVDIVIMGSILDAFDLGDAKKEGIGDLMSYGVAAPCFAVIFLNYFKQEKKWMYVILFTLISLLSEWLLVQVGFMKLKWWQTWWSIPVYIAIFGFWLPWHLRLIRKEY
ncbi:hypothetical protein GI584_15080 [Gracilibacillus salitolerans]|uniref:Uncharacterized protein n=1 Tax=Gracilibacillus salitolerans TaxID=2663022 RepID=A0A5Q2TMB9_9BACI|nr:hypothetical protein [Gracilibacillus salitolerans]QGH35291.1 hypothetical protein GI584_15080 [Gracilibacillus salitolerans]